MAPLFTKAGRARPALSIVIEWENVLLAGPERTRRMLERLTRQTTSAPAFLDGGGEIEILVVHHEMDVARRTIEDSLRDWISAEARTSFTILSAPEGDYYALKNFGGSRARGDVIAFLDSDVIPEAGWLEAFATTFADPRIDVVAGSAYLETTGLVQKALALGWYFPLRPQGHENILATRFFANNVAFRRRVFDAHPFPEIAGSSRGACQALAAELLREGILIHRSLDAVVSHPAPRGLRRTFERAMAEGRDRLFSRRADPDRDVRLRKSASRAIKQVIRAARKVRREHAAVDMPAHQIPAALCLTTAYHGSVLLGDLMTRAFPDLMRTRFRI